MGCSLFPIPPDYGSYIAGLVTEVDRAQLVVRSCAATDCIIDPACIWSCNMVTKNHGLRRQSAVIVSHAPRDFAIFQSSLLVKTTFVIKNPKSGLSGRPYSAGAAVSGTTGRTGGSEASWGPARSCAPGNRP